MASRGSPVKGRGIVERLIGEAGELRAMLAIEEEIAIRTGAEEVEGRLRVILEQAGTVVSGLREFVGSDDPSFRALVAHRRPLSGDADTCETGVRGRSYLARTQALGDTAGAIARVSESQST